jgi:hypothetical protein
MFEKTNANYRATVKEGIRNEKWESCGKAEGVTGIHVFGYIQGTNSYGAYTALVCDNNTNYYIPKWKNESFKADNFTDEELAYLMAGHELTVTKKEYTDKAGAKKSTYNIKIGEYDL